MSGADPAAPRLIGRRLECALLDRLLDDVRGGAGQALVIRGEAGIGKTALLQHAADAAGDCLVARATGVESEMELPFAGLQQLCTPLLDHGHRLPAPQRTALDTAFGLRGGEAPDRLMVSLGVLALLTAAARDRPVVWVVDDLHWLDGPSAETLRFVARRIADLRVAVISTLRLPEGRALAPEVPELVLEGLPDDDARTLLDSVLVGPVDDRVRDQFVAETRGNPLALVQLPRGMTPAELAGGFGGPGGLSGRIEDSFRRRLAPFPAGTRLLLLVAAADHGQDPVVVWRAAAGLGLGVRDAQPAVADGFLHLGATVMFCHPIARSTVYRWAPAEERRRVHTALAAAVDRDAEPERRAWHLAMATSGLDEEIAGELERSADHVLNLGGIAAAALFLERAAELTPDPGLRALRALTAARAKYHAGAPERALRLLTIAETGRQDEPVAARVALVRAQIATRRGRGHEGLLVDVAQRLGRIDAGVALETYRDAFYAGLVGGRLAGRGKLAAVATAFRATVPPVTDRMGADPSVLLLDGLASVVGEGHAAGASTLSAAVRGFCRAGTESTRDLLWLPLACRMAHDTWDDRGWDELSRRMLDQARRRGALNVLPYALLLRSGYEEFAGEVGRGALMADEAMHVADVIDAPHAPYGQAFVAAWRGDRDELERQVATADEAMADRAEGQWITARGYFRALVHNASGDYGAALEAAEQGSAHPDELGIASWASIELVEAAVRSGAPERATATLARLGEMAAAYRTDWITGVHARLSAMTADEDAEAQYRAAIERLGRTTIRTELARAHLVYGEWLRREGRRVDARAELRRALGMFEAMGLDGFAGRARRELGATGETARRRTVDTLVDLTEQESQIARWAAEGLTNPEIGVKLFLSARTVEWHLRRVFGKLGIRSRKDLPSALAAGRHR